MTFGNFNLGIPLRDAKLKESVSSPDGPVAQLVEHRTFNAVVAGSSPARLTILFPLESAIFRLESGCFHNCLTLTMAALSPATMAGRVITIPGVQIAGGASPPSGIPALQADPTVFSK
jgi:hypothetical protein